jgi:hypothetical protein
MKSFSIAATLSIALLSFNNAYAHGLSDPQHGGVLTVSGDWTFELVDTAEGVTVYIYDDTIPYDTKGMTGKLTVNNNGEQSEVALNPADAMTLAASDFDLPAGASVLVVVTLSDGYTKVGSRFSIE